MKVKKQQILQDFLVESFPQTTKSTIKSWLKNKKVQVNKAVESKFSRELNIGDDVEIVKTVILKKVRYDGLTILFEDEYLIVVDKREGLLSISGQNKEENTAFRILSQHVKEESEKNRIFVIHRLDKDTSGVMMYAKSQEIQEKMQKNWQEFVKERLYIAVVEGVVEKEEGEIESYLTEGKTFMVYSSFKPNGGQLAKLQYKKIKSNRYYSMLQVSLDTGKKNQIRVQMQAIGHPISGDRKYGGHSSPIHRIALHARTLNFTHPITGKELKFGVSIPHKFHNLFSRKE